MTRTELHAMVDRLPDASIDEAARALKEVAESDEIDAAEETALDEGLDEASRKKGRPLEDVLSELEL
jgi:hypothetical protein